MKILIVSGFFPPYSPVSGSRVNKLAKYLEQQGHEIKVLAPERYDQINCLTPEISKEKIIYTKFRDINSFPEMVKNYFTNIFSGEVTNQNPGNKKEEHQQKPSSAQGKESFISVLYRNLTNYPDKTIGWYPTAINEGRSLFSQWSPDIIFTTVPPFTALLVASKLARMIDVPWVADYRDLWSEHGYYQGVGIRKKIDRFIENRTLSTCKGLITVTNSWAKQLKGSRDIPVEFVMNGFDPDDFDNNTPIDLFPDHLTILYAGGFYENKRDPAKLFEALGKLGEEAKKIKILLYTDEGIGDLNENHHAIIKKYDLQEQIVCNEYIDQKELLQIELGVDMLLLLRWDDPRESSVVAGKLFEYIGADKPILSVGSTVGEAADIIRDNDLGVVSNDVDEIAKYLKSCIAAKDKDVNWSAPNVNRERFKRSSQFKKLEKFLVNIVDDCI